jgi:hypothetical protein
VLSRPDGTLGFHSKQVHSLNARNSFQMFPTGSDWQFLIRDQNSHNGFLRHRLIWTDFASAISSCVYLTDVLTRIVNGHPNRDIDALLPWAYRKQDLRAVA